MNEAYGRPLSTLGQGGSIPLCNVFTDTYPDAEIILIGVEEPQALIHAPNESIHPDEIANMALTEALFLQNYAAQAGRASGLRDRVLLRVAEGHRRRRQLPQSTRWTRCGGQGCVHPPPCTLLEQG